MIDVLLLWMSRSGFFYPDLSPLIFSVCRYRVPIRNSALTNIFLDNTAALRKKAPASKLFLNRFFMLLKQSIYFHMALSYSACYYNIGLNPPCVSRWVCDAALWQQTLVYSQLKCVRRSSRLVPPYHLLLFSYSLRCHIKWRGHFACLFHTRSASPLLPGLHTLLYETHRPRVHTGTL